MFKKAVEVRSLQRLSGADRKKLKRSVKERFPNASDADIDLILPPKAEITVAKLPNRLLVYSVEGDNLPVIFDVDGRGTDFYPTVFALWKVPDLLPAFMLKGCEVSRYILGGADLMFPGISIPAEGLPSFLAGQPWSIKVPGNQAPLAVGTTTMSSSEALKAGLRGKALRVAHHYRDSLWESVEGHYVPNAGFLDSVVLEDPSLLSVFKTNDSCGDTSNALGEQIVISSKEGAGMDAGHSEHELENSTHFEASKDIPELTLSANNNLKVTGDASVEEANGVKDKQTMSCEEVDALLDRCLLQALHTTVKDKDLPIPGSTLWSNHVLPCRPSGMTLDIKKSSHKKLSKWLQSRSSVGLIKAKEDKHKKEVMLLAVNRKHGDYTSFRPEKQQSDMVNHTSDSKSDEGRPQKSQLEVTEVYKPSVHVNRIFTSVGADTGSVYSVSEATDIAFRYVENEKLVKPTDKAIVILDPILCDALYKGIVKKGSTYPTEIHKKDLGVVFLSRMQVYHRVTRGNESVLRKGALKTVQMTTERRQGNKKVTRVSGLESFLLDAEALASELQKKFACSTTMAELPGKKGQEVIVQGGVIDDLAKHLLEHYAIPKRYIEVLDKTKR